MHRTRSRTKNCNKEVIQLHQASCDHCSTIEGESELSRDKHRTTQNQPANIPYAPSHWCHDERPGSGTVPYTEGPTLIQPLQDTMCNTLGT